MTVGLTRHTGGPRQDERCRVVRSPADLADHHAVRLAVFVAEQGVFSDSDRDALDDDPATLHVVGRAGETPAGAVRLYPHGGPGEWRGDRLAVLPAHRTGSLGAGLVRYAVAAAAERGGLRMTAHVQPANEVFFRHLGWYRTGPPVDYVGLPHVPMAIPLG